MNFLYLVLFVALALLMGPSVMAAFVYVTSSLGLKWGFLAMVLVIAAFLWVMQRL